MSFDDYNYENHNKYILVDKTASKIIHETDEESLILTSRKIENCPVSEMPYEQLNIET